MHEGPWAKGCTHNRELIKAAQSMAHAIERDPEKRAICEAEYAEYKATLPPGTTHCYKFYGFVFTTIYHEMRHELGIE